MNVAFIQCNLKFIKVLIDLINKLKKGGNMLYIFLLLVFFYLVGDNKKHKNTMRKIERDIFISDVISGKRKP